MKKLFLITVTPWLFLYSSGQGFNNNTDKAPINIALPKTPESQSFERYGSIPVSEATGIPNISFPLFSLESRYLKIPVTLSYHASGIKVSQEATWVGLGFDIISGGRITVETKGNVDENVRSFTNSPDFRTSLARIFNRRGTSHYTSLLGYAFLDYGTIYGADPASGQFPGMGDTAWDRYDVVTSAAWFGTGEPDIYHANFLGNSLDFYIDLLTDQIKLIGEKSLFEIVIQRDGQQKIQSFVIRDTNGNTYYFEQKEKTRLTAAPFHGVATAYESTTAWLLTKVVHPSGDNILFTYSGFGKIYPAFNWSASQSLTMPANFGGPSPDWPQNQLEMDPWYLTKIESSNASLDFILSAREDIQGPGARKLDAIRLNNKLTGQVIKTIGFDYEYFIGAAENGEYFLPDSIKQYYRKRLKLTSFKIFNNDQSPTHYFYYTNPNVPGKLSFSQDHWGYYNGATNSFYPGGNDSPQNLVPAFSGLGSIANRSIGPFILQVTGVQCNGIPMATNPGPPDASSIPAGLDGWGNRNCSPFASMAMMMDSIKYPTGGSVKIEYEPHVSDYQHKSINGLVGGGLRVKSIRTFIAPGNLESIVEYKYEVSDGGQPSGIYLGSMEYIRITNKSSYRGQNWMCGASEPMISLSSSGDLNADNSTVGYTRVKISTKGSNNQASNGFIVKYFNFQNPFQVEYKAIAPPFNSGSFNLSGVNYLLKNWANVPAAPYRNLDGKMYREEIYNNLGELVKASDYYYRQADYSQNFYSFQVEDNYANAFGQLTVGSGDIGYGHGNASIGWLRFRMLITPAKSFYTLLDSMTEKTYAGNSYITRKKTYKYNQYFQPEYEGTNNSDGTETIIYTRTSLNQPTLAYSLAPTGDALELLLLKNSLHIYDLPIEQIALKRNPKGDTIVLGGHFNIYNGILPKKSYKLEAVGPLAYRGQFTPYYMTYPNYPNSPTGNTYSIKMDDKYRISETAQYNPASLPKDINNQTGIAAYLWDTAYNNLIAQAVNATESDIAYTSFESNNFGNWILNPAGITNVSFAPTGSKGFSMAGNTITKTGLSAAKTYIVSYWSTGGSQNVNSATAVRRKSLGAWSYYEHQVINPAGGNIIISGSGIVDELRLYPAKAMMTTYTYEPLVGITNQCDVNNNVTYYEYDIIGRLSRVRDSRRNILKQFEYKYGDLFQFPFGNTEQSMTWNKQGCAPGYSGSSYTLSVPPNKYGSFLNVEDANRKAMNEINAFDGQSYVNMTGTCAAYYTWSACCGWASPYYNFSLTGTGDVNFSFVVAKQNGTIAVGTTYQVANLGGVAFLPVSNKVVNVYEGGRIWEATIMTNGQIFIKLISGSVPSYASLSGTYALN